MSSENAVIARELLRFLQSGATHLIGRPVALVNPATGDRTDPLTKEDQYADFCRYLRRPRSQGGLGGETSCEECSLAAARAAMLEGRIGEVLRYRCYMGCEEMAVPLIDCGDVQLVAITGQFGAPEGLGDIDAAVGALGVGAPVRAALSDGMQRSLLMLGLPPSCWAQISPSDEERGTLLSLMRDLRPSTSEDEVSVLLQAGRVRQIVGDYLELARAKTQAQVRYNLADSVSRVPPMLAESPFWHDVGEPLSLFCDQLGLEYAIFFCGDDEYDTVLRPRAANARFTLTDALLHFNWRKAGLRTGDHRDTPDQTLEWQGVDVLSPGTMRRGLQGGSSQALSAPLAVVPARLHSGPFAALFVGPPVGRATDEPERRHIADTAKDLCLRLLTLRIPELLRQERTHWERTAKMTGHRVRTAIQSVNSQIQTIKAVLAAEPGFGERDRRAAERDLAKAFKDLTQISYAAESSIPGAIGARILGRERIGLGVLVASAVETQQLLADQHGIEIDVHADIDKLPLVYVNPALARFVFMNLVNNGLKYSFPRPDNKPRVLTVKRTNLRLGIDEVGVEVTNFGLGIKEVDLPRVFEWGVRLAGSAPTFRDIYGRGIGLWECKDVVEAHGGRMVVASVHSSADPVTDKNIEHCITTFTVVLPQG